MYEMSVIVLLDTAIQIFIAIAVVSLITAFVLFGLSGRLTFFKFKKKKEIKMAAGNVLCLVKCSYNSWTYSI